MVLVLWTAMLAFAQSSLDPAWQDVYKYSIDSANLASGRSVFQVTRPDVIVEVFKHQLGADMFDVTAVDPAYPLQLLQDQCTKIGELSGHKIRGLAAGKYRVGNDPRMVFSKASFAIDGIIDRQAGILHLEPIIKAFAGATAPMTVKAISVIFNGEAPTRQTLRSFQNQDMRVDATVNKRPAMIEYRVQLLTQDPNALSVPDASPTEPVTVIPSTPQSRSGAKWIMWIALALAAVAAGVLVYFLLLRSAPKPRR